VRWLAAAGPCSTPSQPSNRHADGKQVLAKEEKVGQHHHLLLPLGGGIGFILHEQLCHYLAVDVHHGNPSNTLWAVGAG
jgi:hypothetical protein